MPLPENGAEMRRMEHIETEALSQRLHQLSPDSFLELYRLYEKLGRETEVVAEMDVLRARLTRLRPKRAPAFTRVLCQPFESFIVGDDDYGPWQVPRSCCGALGALVQSRMGAAKYEAMAAELKNLDPEDDEAVMKSAHNLWRQASQALSSMTDQEKKVLPPPLRASLDLIKGCISVGVAMVTLANGVARQRFRHLDKRGLAHLGRIFDVLPEAQIESGLYPLVMLSRRMDNPAGILSVLNNPELPLRAPVRSQLVKMMEAYLEREFQAEAERIDDLIRETGKGGPKVELETLHRATAMAMEQRSAGVASVAASRLVKTISAHVLATFVDPAPDILQQNLDPFFSDPGEREQGPDMEALANAETCLLDLMSLSRDGRALAIGSHVHRITTDWSERIRQALTERIAQKNLPVTVGNQTRHELFEFYSMLRLVEILDGPDRAEEFRRAGEATIVSPARAANA